MLNLGYEIALPVGVNLHPCQEHALSGSLRGCNEKNEKKSVFTIVIK